MTNNFATIQGNQTSKKFMMVRINPARYINDDLSDIGGGLYTITLSNFIISAVQENGTDLTLVTGTPTSGEYSFNDSTGLLTIYPTAAPSSTNAIIGFYYLFYTGEKDRVWYEDPEDSGTTKRAWEGKLSGTIAITQDVTNVLAGILSINSSSIEIINDNFDFNKYLSEEDSFYKKDIKIWTCLDSEENIQKVFEGTVTNLSLTNTRITLEIEDTISNLTNKATMGDSVDEIWFRTTSHTIYPTYDNTPIRFIFGSLSKGDLRRTTVLSSINPFPELIDTGELIPETLNEAVCTSYTSDLSVSANRTWGCCRVPTDGFLDFSHTPSNINTTDANYTRFTTTAGNIAKLSIGDTIAVNHSGTDYYGRIIRLGTTTYETTPIGTITTGDDVQANNCPSVIIIDQENDAEYYCLYGRDYTATVSATSGGNKYLEITFVNNFEASFGLAILDPSIHQVYFRCKPDTTNMKHGSVVKRLLEENGLTVNATSISTANAALSVNAAFSIPFFDEYEYGTYYNYLEQILKSTLACIHINNSFEIEYELLETPSSTDTITDDEILKDSYSVSFDYKDIHPVITARNPHYNLTLVGGGLSRQTNTDIRSTYLHGLTTELEFNHVLEDYSGKIDDLVNIYSNRRAEYQFNTKTVNLDSLIKDDLLLSKNGLLGADTTRSVTIMGMTKHKDSVTINANDFIKL